MSEDVNENNNTIEYPSVFLSGKSQDIFFRGQPAPLSPAKYLVVNKNHPMDIFGEYDEGEINDLLRAGLIHPKYSIISDQDGEWKEYYTHLNFNRRKSCLLNSYRNTPS